MQQGVLALAAALYVAATGLLALFVGSFGVLIALYLRTRHRSTPLPPVRDDDLPAVTVQLPVYNEAHVVARLIAACARLDYPRDRLHIQIIDDSTDETTREIQRAMAACERRGAPPMTLLRRPVRTGYKAGALTWGLQQVRTPFVALFDADFIPPRDFLRRTLPFFCADERLALVQTRWDHLNAHATPLTRAQALTTDGHFVIEQIARSRGGLPMSMNGSGGVWRVAALQDAGGWSADTLTEDLDLSYRALLRGWRFCYLPDVAVPGELTPQVQAYKRQQRRWATGMTQNLLRHAIPLLKAKRYAPWQRVMGLMHLGQYAVQPLILLTLLLTPPLVASGTLARLPALGALSALGVIPPLMMILSQRALHRDWARRLLALPLQGLIATALVLNNTLGVLDALLRTRAAREFRRTPKFSVTGRARAWEHSRYALPADRVTLGELALGLYALWGLSVALASAPAFVPYFAIYALSLIGFALWNLVQTWQIHGAGRRANGERRPRQRLRRGDASHQPGLAPLLRKGVLRYTSASLTRTLPKEKP